MNLKDLAKSEYYKPLVENYQREMSELMQPENIPDTDLADVKAHKKILAFLQNKIKELKMLREDSNEMSSAESYE